MTSWVCCHLPIFLWCGEETTWHYTKQSTSSLEPPSLWSFDLVWLKAISRAPWQNKLKKGVIYILCGICTSWWTILSACLKQILYHLRVFSNCKNFYVSRSIHFLLSANFLFPRDLEMCLILYFTDEWWSSMPLLRIWQTTRNPPQRVPWWNCKLDVQSFALDSGQPVHLNQIICFSSACST